MDALFKIRLFKEKELEDLKQIFFEKAFSEDLSGVLKSKKILTWYDMEWEEFSSKINRKFPGLLPEQLRRIEVFFKRYKWKILKVSVEISMLKFTMLRKSR